MPYCGDENEIQDESHDESADEISNLKEDILQLFSQYQQTHDSDG